MVPANRLWPADVMRPMRPGNLEHGGQYHVAFMVESHQVSRGLTFLEIIIALLLIGALVSILVPALSTARQASYREHCAHNLDLFSKAWKSYLDDHNGTYPTVPVQPAWSYAGVRFAVDGDVFPDTNRPLTPYLPLTRTSDVSSVVCFCPADRGITDPVVPIGTGRQTAFRSFGTSYRANAALFDATIAGVDPHPRGLKRNEITTPPSRLVLMGDPVWYEVSEATGRDADWHHQPDTGNLLFLDGSVRFLRVRSKKVAGPIVFTPVMPGITGPSGQPIEP